MSARSEDRNHKGTYRDTQRQYSGRTPTQDLLRAITHSISGRHAGGKNGQWHATPAVDMVQRVELDFRLPTPRVQRLQHEPFRRSWDSECVLDERPAHAMFLESG